MVAGVARPNCSAQPFIRARSRLPSKNKPNLGDVRIEVARLLRLALGCEWSKLPAPRASQAYDGLGQLTKARGAIDMFLII